MSGTAGDRRLAILGAGNMAEAITRAALDAGVLTASSIVAIDPEPSRREVFAAMGVDATPEGGDALGEAEVVLLAVKPQVFPLLSGTLQALPEDRRLWVSIMAGTPIERIASIVGAGQPVVRVMPNTPLLVGMGMSVIAAGAGVDPADLDWAETLFAAAGRTLRAPESAMDAVTAVSGSGPAYLFYLAEAMMAAASRAGLDEADSRLLVVQTLRGAGELLASTDAPPAELRRRVTSPGGTTEAAVSSLDQTDAAGTVAERVIKAILAARDRSVELGAASRDQPGR